jgi:hypothetical protein
LSVNAGGMPGSEWVRISGVIVVATSGTLSFQWSQASNHATATNVGVGAWLICTKLA